MLKKLLCMLLSVLLCFGMLISCAEDPVEPEDDPALPSPDGEGEGGDGAEEESPYADSLPEKSLGGIDIVVAYYDLGPIKSGCSVDAEENNGDLINDAMYDRNRAIEERFDVCILGANQGGGPGMSPQVIPVLTSGSDEFDVLVGYQYYDIVMAATGLLYNFNNLSEKYIDIESPWWSTDYINNINYADKLYWLTGDITLAHIGSMVVSYVNADIYGEHVEPEFGNLYDIIREQEWTFDTMIEMAELAYVDLNGNDKPDRGDQFGYQQSLGVEMAFCAGINSSVRDDSGNITVAIDNDQTADIMWYLSEISEAPFSTMDPTADGQYRIFTSGEAMIYFRDMMAAESAMFRSMEDDFFIVPIPMGNELCEGYRSTCATGCSIIGISHCSSYPEEASLVLEALAAESYTSVTPLYYDTLIKDRYTRDEASKEMIDLIRSSVAVDFVNTWSYGYTDAYSFYATFNTNTVASRIAACVPKWEAVLTELLETLDQLP